MKIKNINGNMEQYGNVREIRIYGNGKILYACNRAYFEKHKIYKNKYGHDAITTDSYPYVLDGITLAQPIKNARKENLNRTDNYMLHSPGRYSFEPTKILYIHESEISVIPYGEVTGMETDDERNFIYAYQLVFNNPVSVITLHYEKMTYDPHFVPPAGCNWSDAYGSKDFPTYSVFDSKCVSRFKNKPIEKHIAKKYRTVDEISGFSCFETSHIYHRTEESKNRKRLRNIAAALESAGIKINGNTLSYYDIEQLERVCNISLKKEAQ